MCDDDKQDALLRDLANVVDGEAERWGRIPVAQWERYRQWPVKLSRWTQKHGDVDWKCNLARHTFATTLARRGQLYDRDADAWRALTVFDLQRLMGHDSVRTTERHYLGHFTPSLQLKLAESYGQTEKHEG